VPVWNRAAPRKREKESTELRKRKLRRGNRSFEINHDGVKKGVVGKLGIHLFRSKDWHPLQRRAKKEGLPRKAEKIKNNRKKP